MNDFCTLVWCARVALFGLQRLQFLKGFNRPKSCRFASMRLKTLQNARTPNQRVQDSSSSPCAPTNDFKHLAGGIFRIPTKRISCSKHIQKECTPGCLISSIATPSQRLTVQVIKIVE